MNADENRVHRSNYSTLILMTLLEHLDPAVPEAVILLDFSVPRVNWFLFGLKLDGIRGLSLAIMRS